MARNRYPGYCYKCGKWIEIGYGHFERNGNGWRIQCVKCCSGRILNDDDPGVKKAQRMEKETGGKYGKHLQRQ